MLHAHFHIWYVEISQARAIQALKINKAISCFPLLNGSAADTLKGF